MSKDTALKKKLLAQRYAREKRFKLFGLSAVIIAIFFVLLIFFIIISNGYGVFLQTKILLNVDLSNVQANIQSIEKTNFKSLIKQTMRKQFPSVEGRKNLRKLYKLLSSHASFELRNHLLDNPDSAGETLAIWITADDKVDLYAKGKLVTNLPETNRQLARLEISWLRELESQNRLQKHFNTTFFTAGSSRHAEQAGILTALTGSLYAIFIAFLLSFPIGIAAAIYLEEFAPQNIFTDLIEVNINNLAAVPSIIFGLLGLAIFINFFGLPRSSSLVGGIVLALMTLPTVIIASRVAIKAVPGSIRKAALGLGASHMQTILHHILPLAMPGMLTGSILGMAQALGETAPLMMIGMVAFIVDPPTTIIEPATALPVQIFIWANNPEAAFIERTAGAIIVLLFILLTINATAIYFRKKLERHF